MIYLTIALVCIAIVWAVSLYNRIVRLLNNRENALSNIDVQLRLRHDLIPNLVSCVKGYAAHEHDTLIKVTQARAAAMQAGSTEERLRQEALLSQTLANLRVALEKYPDLKANTNFMYLQTQLTDIENKIVAVRRYFNSATREYNDAIATFPGNLIASAFGFQKEGMLEFDPTTKVVIDTPPTIKF